MQSAATTNIPAQRFARSCFSLMLAGSALLALGSALAQPHEAVRDGYTLRASTVVSTALAPKTAQSHGIDPARDRGVLNVMVEKTNPTRDNVPADVTAFTRNLAGMQVQVPMREARAPNGMVSYVGGYDFAPREVLDFHVTARPRGESTELSLVFRDRLPTVTR